MKSKSKLIVITILAILLYIIYYSFILKNSVENYVGRNNVYVLFNFDLNNNYSVKSELNNENSYDKTNLETYKDQYITIYINEGVENEHFAGRFCLSPSDTPIVHRAQNEHFVWVVTP